MFHNGTHNTRRNGSSKICHWVDTQGCDAETLVELTREMSTILSEEAIILEDSRCFYRLCIDMANDFQMRHADENWDVADFLSAIIRYSILVKEQLCRFPNWINTEYRWMYGTETVPEFLSKQWPRDLLAEPCSGRIIPQRFARSSRPGSDETPQNHLRSRLLLAYAQVPLRQRNTCNKCWFLAGKTSRQCRKRQEKSAKAKETGLASSYYLGMPNPKSWETDKKNRIIPCRRQSLNLFVTSRFLRICVNRVNLYPRHLCLFVVSIPRLIVWKYHKNHKTVTWT